ncbi:MAG: ribonuclease H family protein [bacterium]|nr:ribonuclease H family protein [bacterium]
MADIAKIELVVKSSVGHLVAAEQIGDVWRCHIHIPRNVEARLRGMSKAFPEMEIESQLGKDVIVRIPAQKNGTAAIVPDSNEPAPAFDRPRPAITLNTSLSDTHFPSERVLPPDEQVRRLGKLYESFFASTCDVQMMEGGRVRVNFEEALRYPSTHPFLALLPRLTDLVPVAYAGEQLGRQPKFSIYLAKPEQRMRYRYDHVLIHIDGSYRDGVGAFGARYLMTGHPPAYLSGALNVKDSSGAELLAFLQALAHLDASARNLAIFTDSGYVLSWIKHEGRPWLEQAIKKHGSVRVQHVHREENRAAHSLANRMMSRLFE